MSITDELRHNIKGAEQLYGRECTRLTAIADRIDAEHEESIQREHESAYDAGYAEGMGVANKADMRAEYLRGKNDGYDEGWDSAAKTMTEHMVELPKDADGEHIHVGDVLDGYGKTIEAVELRIGRSGWVIISRDGNGYADTFAFTHHALTVEDVLREFAYGLGVPVADSYIAASATKLRLAEGED